MCFPIIGVSECQMHETRVKIFTEIFVRVINEIKDFILRRLSANEASSIYKVFIHSLNYKQYFLKRRANCLCFEFRIIFINLLIRKE